MAYTHKIQKEEFGERRMSKKQIEVVRAFAEPSKERDDKIIKEAAKAIASYIKRKQLN